MSFPLSKSKLQSHHQCAKKLWLEIYHPELAPVNEVQQLIFDRGTAFGDAIRSNFADGVLIATKLSHKALIETAELINSFATGTKRVPIFEAAFMYKGTIVRVDVLNPLSDGTWELIEVKSGSFKPSHVRDAAIQAYVIGMSCTSFSLSTISVGVPESTYIYTGTTNFPGILTFIDKTNEAKALFAEIESSIEAALETIKLAEAPRVNLGAQCKSPYACGFAAHCSNAYLAPTEKFIVPVWHLSKDPLVKIVQKFLPNTRDLASVNGNDLETPIQRQMREVACGKPYYLDPKLHEFLEEQPFPRYFLDFETNNSPLPMWIGTHPGEVIPFQFSIHVWTAPDAPLQHHEFIAPTNVDPRPALAKALDTISGGRGFDALFHLRQDMFDQAWQQLSITQRTPEMAEMYANAINNATGFTKGGKASAGILQSPITKILFFAPKLIASRFKWLIQDPARMLGTFGKMANPFLKVSPEERMSAIYEAKNKAKFLGVLTGTLLANQALLSITGSNQSVNFLDPKKRDWLAYKGFGYELATIGAFTRIFRLVAQ